MARTIRRRRIATTIQGYISKRLIQSRHDYENDERRLKACATGKQIDVTYEQYVKDTIEAFHRDKIDNSWRFEIFWWSVPREVRLTSLKRQHRAHKHAIHAGLRSDDLDVVLQARDSRELIDWWMYF
jgi:hypothetical protein